MDTLAAGSARPARATGARAAADAAARLADLDPGRALPVARDAAAQARRARDPAAGAVAERAWGHALLHCGEMDDAIRHLRRSVACGQRAGSDALAAEARVKLAYALFQRGRPRQALTEVDAALRGLDGAAAARGRGQRAIVLRFVGRLAEALAECDAALDVLRAAGDTLSVQRVLVNRALVHADLHAFDAAEADLVEAERLAGQLGRTLALGIIAENRALVEGLRGDVPAALGHLDQAERIMTEHSHGTQRGAVYRDRAELLLSVGLVSEARTAAEHAVAAYRRERRLLKVPEARLLLAQAAHLDRDWAAALHQSRAAMREFTRQQRAEWAELARLETLRAQLAGTRAPRLPAATVRAFVDTLAVTGWPAAALEARLVAAQLSPTATAPAAADGAAANRPAPAGPAPDERTPSVPAPDVATADRTTAGATDRAAYLEEAAGARRAGPAALRARGWYAQALVCLGHGDGRGVTAAARAGLRILDEHAAAMGAADLRAHSAIHRTELAELGLRTALESGSAARVLEWAERGRASRLLHRPARPPDDPELAHLLSELRAVVGDLTRARDGGAPVARLTARQVTLERHIRDHSRQRPGRLDGPLAQPVTPARLSPALGEWALLEFVQLDGQVHGLSLASGQLRLRPLGPVAEVADLVARLPFALHRMGNQRATRGGHDAALALLRWAAERLDAALLRPFAAEFGDRPLVVVPTGPLHGVPWSTLPSCAGRPLVVSPAATLWHAATTSLTSSVHRSVGVAAGPLLRGAREEALAVAAVHGATALVGEAATSGAVLAALGSADLVHLAAHGRLSADNPLFSSLLLADGPLVVYDLEQLPRAPRTVVLAACDSGRSVVRSGDELLGLSAALLAGGTARLVASVVPVPDAETAPLMVALHQRLAAGDSPAVALAGAQRSIAGDDPAVLAAAAGFVCLGTG